MTFQEIRRKTKITKIPTKFYYYLISPFSDISELTSPLLTASTPPPLLIPRDLRLIAGDRIAVGLRTDLRKFADILGGSPKPYMKKSIKLEL